MTLSAPRLILTGRVVCKGVSAGADCVVGAVPPTLCEEKRLRGILRKTKPKAPRPSGEASEATILPRLALQAACRAADEPLEGGHSPDRLCCRQRWSWPHPGRAPPARQPPPSAAARRRASPLLLSGVRPRVAAQYSVGRGWWLPLDDDRAGLARRPPLCLPPEVARRPSFLLMTTGRRTREPRDGDRRERPPGSASFSIAAAVPS